MCLCVGGWVAVGVLQIRDRGQKGKVVGRRQHPESLVLEVWWSGRGGSSAFSLFFFPVPFL